MSHFRLQTREEDGIPQNVISKALPVIPREVGIYTKRVLDKKNEDAIRHLFCRSVSPLKLTNIVIFCYDARSIFCAMGTGLQKRQHSLESLVKLITSGFSRSLITNALSTTTSGLPGAQDDALCCKMMKKCSKFWLHANFQKKIVFFSIDSISHLLS